MPNGKNRKTVAFTVSKEYPYTGSQIKKEMTRFFQYLWKNKESRKVMKEYEEFDKIKVILGQWA